MQCDGTGVDGRIYRLFSWEQRIPPIQTLRTAIRVALEYGALTVGVETDQGGDVVQRLSRAWRDLQAEGAIPAARGNRCSKPPRPARSAAKGERGKIC